ncbi:hypothetical protein HNY73_019072 [Argiope bruennichi]|uniref:DUF19 domain-containing protein n=1 Tax=Argiope bruennichi TaxID=94029 RepID=A0A8T0EF04_ARGBR|nr:hypothetical protein HNY73_019072 [Argiope bruennichi]
MRRKVVREGQAMKREGEGREKGKRQQKERQEPAQRTEGRQEGQHNKDKESLEEGGYKPVERRHVRGGRGRAWSGEPVEWLKAMEEHLERGWVHPKARRAKRRPLCFTRNAYKCDMSFKTSAFELEIAVTRICRTDAVKKWFDEEKECYKKSVNASECVGPINQAMSDLKTPEDFILSNKKVCNLFKPYSTCARETVEENCGRINKVLFDWLFVPLQRLSNSLCEELILPADEKDTRPDNFGNLNVFATVAAIFFAN